jgi:hypothetical protein
MMQKSVESMQKMQTALVQTAQAAGALTSAAIDTKGMGDIVVWIPIGGVGASGTVTAKVTECDTSGGSFTDITGAVFPAVATATAGPQAANGLGDDAVYGIELRQGSHKRFIKVVLTVGVATMVGGVGALVQSFFPQDSALAMGSLGTGKDAIVAVV